MIDDEFEHNPPVFRPDAALSFRVREDLNWVARAPARLRNSVLELEYFQDRGDQWPLVILENLQVLNVHLFDIRLSLFVHLARQAPQLASLRLEYATNDDRHMIHSMERDIEAANEGVFLISASAAVDPSSVPVHRHTRRSQALAPARPDNLAEVVYSSDCEAFAADDVCCG